MKAKLNDIANILTGVFTRTIPSGDIVYLQAKHFDEYGNISSALHPDIQSTNDVKRHLLKDGDVLFAAKGTKNFAAVYKSDYPAAVASTTFFVIRINNNKVLPEYLTWYLNNPSILAVLKGKAIGSSIVSISKTVLAELEVCIPNLATQELILKIVQLRQHEIKLRDQIELLREKRIQQILMNGIK